MRFGLSVGPFFVSTGGRRRRSRQISKRAKVMCYALGFAIALAMVIYAQVTGAYNY